MGTCSHHDYCVSKVPLFSELNKDKLKEINDLVRKKEYKNGELIFMEGSPGKNIYILESGTVKLFKTGKNGHEYILHLLKEGQFFGQLVLFKEEALNTSAEAIGDCNICVVNKKDLEELIRNNPEISFKLLSTISSRLNKAEQMIESLALEDAREKTVRFLTDLAQEDGIKKEEGVMIKLPLSRSGLANFLGMSQETLSRKLSQLQKERLITIEGQKKVMIKNL